MPQLHRSVVLLTGAAGALGSSTAKTLAAVGARLALVDQDAAGLQRVAESLSSAAEDVAVLQCDLLDADAVGGVVERAETALGPLDVLISCAGNEFNGPFDSTEQSVLDQQIDLHLRGPMTLIRSAVPGMLERQRGFVVVVSSLNGKIPFPAKVPYCAAKAGSIAMVHALRREYRDAPIGFSAILPALVTGGGQATRAIEEAGVQPPRGAPTTTVEDCAEAIVGAIRRGSPEVAVTSKPVRLGAALQWSFPAVLDRPLERTGMPNFWRRLGGVPSRR